MPKAVIDNKGKLHNEGEPGYATAKVHALEDTVRELVYAVSGLQIRLAEVDGGDVPWPGDTYSPDNRGPE